MVYGLLNMAFVQNYIKDKVVTELKKQLQTNLDIKSLYIQPFSVIQLNGVYLNDRNDSTILKANKIYADFDILPLINKKLVINAASLSDFDVNLAKDSANAPLNIQFIIDAFKPKEESKNQKIQVKISSINIADGRFKFDVKDRPHNTDKFDQNHIEVSNINAKLALKSLEPDSLNIQIKKLNLEEKSGLKIDNLIVRLITRDNHLYVKGFKLSLPKSMLQFEKCEIDYADTTNGRSIIDRAVFDAQISSSYIALKDIAPIVPAFKHFEDRILFKTKIKGTLDSMQISDITLDYGDKMHISAQGALNNFRNKEKLWISAQVNNLTVSEDGINSLINNFSQNKVEHSPILKNLGTITFNGSLNGQLKKLNAVGNFGTQLGAIHGGLDFGFEPDEQTASYFQGKVNTTDFKLGELLTNKDLEDFSFNLDVNVIKPKNGRLKGDIAGIIKKITYKKYTYHDIEIDGKYDGLRIDGGLALNDENAVFDINGLFDLSKKDPELNFDAKLKNVRFDKLNLSDKYKDSYLSLTVDANFTGKNIDDIQGYIKVDSIRFLQPDKRFEMDNFIIQASGEEDLRLLTINSDIINGQVKGAYSFTTIAESVQRTLNSYLPSLINYSPTKNRNKKIKDNNLTFELTINNTEAASDIFQLPVTIYSPTKIIGYYNNQIERFKFETYLPSIKAGGSMIEAGHFLLENDADRIKSKLSGTFVTKKQTLNNLSSDISISDDLIDIHTLFLNKDQSKLKGEFSNTIRFSRLEKNTLKTDINFKPGELVLNNAIWKIKDSHISILPNNILIDGFQINNSHKDQQLDVNGTYSTNNQDERLTVKLQNIDLDYVFKTLAIDALQFSGLASGEIGVSTIEKQPYAQVNLDVADFGFNNTTLGHLILDSEFDPDTKKVKMDGSITNENNKVTAIDGFINPLSQELSIHFDSQEVNIAFLNKYVSTLFSNVQGKGHGKVHLFGDFSDVTIEGEAFIENGGLGINFLNTYYTFTDSVYLKKDLIYFSDIAFKDQKGNTALISGKVAHDYFSNFMYYIDLKGDNFMLYNATENINPMFYGTVIGSGTGVIKGDEHALDINVNMQTQSNTNIVMNFMEDVATEYSFITYKPKETAADSISSNSEKFKLSRMKTDSGMEINMNFYIDATPDANVELVMDPVGGDRLKGTGSGALQFVWGTNKEPMLYGTYQINKGSYNFTFQKILERKFSIQEGSHVLFRGDPFQADIDITAKYRVIANLNDLDQNMAKTTGQASVPVNCVMNMTGALRRPNINLDIELPSADSEVQRQIKSLMSTEDMINRQIVYLLLLSKFYTPNYAITESKTSDLAAVASATLSTQLSKILSQIDDRWQVGTNIRTSDSDFSSTEVELLLSSRLLNDRVLFNGNFGYRDNPMTQDAFIGDIDIEVLLNRVGTWRLKAYNHYNEKYYYVGANGGSGVQTQGIGILYKKDFDNIKELFTRPQKEQKPAKKDTVRDMSEFVKMKK